MAHSMRGELTEWLQFLQAESHILKDHPGLIYQQAANSSPQSAVARRAAQVEQQGRWPPRPWLRRLNRPGAAGPCLMILTGHNGAVRALAASADGMRLVSGCNSGTLKVWDTRSGQNVRSIAAHAEVCALALHPDGRLLISSGSKQDLALWDLDSGRRMAEVKSLASGTIYALAAAPDGRRVVSVNQDGTMGVWSFESLALERSFPRQFAHSVTVTPDGSGILAGGSKLRLLDMQTGSEQWSLDGHKGNIYAVAVSRDGRIAVSGAEDGRVVVWDVDGRRSLRTLSMVEAIEKRNAVPYILPPPLVCSVALTPDNRRILVGGYNRTLWVWDLETGRLLHGLDGHGGWIWKLAMTGDGRVFSASEDSTVRVWSPEAVKSAPQVARAEPSGIDLCPDGRRALCCYQDGACALVDARSGEEMMTFRLPEGEVASAACMTPDGRYVVLGGDKGSLEMWDAGTGGKLRSLSGPKTRMPKGSPTSRPHAVSSLTLTGYGRRLAGFNSLLELPARRVVDFLWGDERLKASSPDGLWVASAGYDTGGVGFKPGVQVAAAEGGRVVRWIKPPQNWAPPAFRFMPDSRRIACAAAAGGVEVSDIQSGEVAARFAGDWKRPFHISVSPDGRLIVVADEHRIGAWNSETGQSQWDRPAETTPSQWDRGMAAPIPFSEDGRFLFTQGSVLESQSGETILVSGYRYLTDSVSSLFLGREAAGSQVLLELCGTKVGPWIVTAEQDGGRLVFLCPRCQTQTVCDTPALGTVTSCPRCGEGLKLNPFTLRTRKLKEYDPVNYVELLWGFATLLLIALVWYAGIGIWRAHGKTTVGLVIMVVGCILAMMLLLDGLRRLRERE